MRSNFAEGFATRVTEGSIPFAERKFDVDGSELVTRFYLPVRVASGEFQCRWSITWKEGEEGRHACGEDGVQALLLAMRLVHTRLVDSDAYREGRLTLWGQSDLDLPPCFSEDGPFGLLPSG
jgi:hypothetical protein